MKSEIRRALPVLLSACALSGSVLAQDSTSILTALPGDSVDPKSTSEQVNDYTVDLGALKSTSGRVYGVAPLAKASMDYLNPNFFNAGMSAQSISRNTLQAVPFARNSYSSWNAAGSGINNDPLKNNPGTAVNTSASVGNQFGYAFAQFSYDHPDLQAIAFNGIIGGVVNYESSSPSRLYVTRVQAADNDTTWLCNVSQFGMGSVDANGWVGFRADGYNTVDCGGDIALTGDNLFLVNTLARNAAAHNLISDAGASDTGIRLLTNSGTTHSPISMIPSSITGGTPIAMGSNFSSQYVYGNGTGALTATSAHFGGSVSDHRGLMSYSSKTFPGIFGATATAGVGANLGVSSGTNNLNVFGVAATGAPVAPIGLTYPGNASISDPSTGWSPAAGSASFANYYSSTAFRGGTGQVAVGKDQAGRLLAAGMMHHPSFGSSTEPSNMIAVARTANGTAIEWVIAAYSDGSSGKPVYGDFGANVVGTLVGYEPGSTNMAGPSITSPMMDSVGNIYFNGRVLMNGEGFYRDSLVRAVYNPTSFSYQLELVLQEGDVVKGGNSNTNYEIQYLQISGSTGTVPSAPWSQNINQSTYNGADAQTLDSTTTQGLGGIVIAATVIYDVDGDGDYDRQSFDPLSLDQDYATLLYVSAAADCNNNGIPDDLDIADGTSTDTDGNGIPDDCSVGASFCLGDGTGPFCPCGNFGGTGQGCQNSSGIGATLTSTGTASIGADDLGFNGVGLPTNKPTLLFTGNVSTSALLGDGVRCVGGQIKRYPVQLSSGTGTGSWGPALQSVGGYSSGDTRYFQLWYRDPVGGPCGSGFNLSSGVSVTFVP